MVYDAFEVTHSTGSAIVISPTLKEINDAE
jgi:hypothetical protein